VTRLLVAAYLIYGGLLLGMGPWTRLWQPEVFASLAPWLDSALASRFMRGAASGVGLLMVIGGARDLIAVLFARGPAVPTAAVDDHAP
jgi:hypothetical protein